MGLEEQIVDASYSAFVKYIKHDETLRPTLVVNKEGVHTVLSFIENNLETCTSFSFSVAFITNHGFEMLLQSLDDAERRGVKGRILTTDYLTFTEPKALRRLKEYENIELRMYRGYQFHTKGYFFEQGEKRTIMVGSANITNGALKTNAEWNVSLSSLESGQIVSEYSAEFERMWNAAEAVDEKLLDEYSRIYEKSAEIRREAGAISIEKFIIEPNEMQLEAVEALRNMRAEGRDRALVIAATGTGKTLLTVFDCKEYNPNRLLFIAHRAEILSKSREVFIEFLSLKEGDTGLIVDGKKETDRRFTFASIQSLKSNCLYRSFKPDEFDYIIIDEVHRGMADSYLELIDYFRPKFLLGLSATPDRPDKKNIYELFNYNVAVDIRLKQALEKKLVIPFHYFGIADVTVDGIVLDDKSDFKYLTSDERVDRILEASKHFGYSGPRVRGLIFCSRVEEAHKLTQIINERGYRARCVDGGTSHETREEYIEMLQAEEGEDAIDFILSVDVFNEGVDIPLVNQVIMLRPTMSSIIFIQQLGRGLRKSGDKEFTVVIDFIGNYDNNFLIPVALSGDATYDKDAMRKYVENGSVEIPGSSTVNFSPIAKEKIFDSIDRANTSNLKFLKGEYLGLKNRLGRVPRISDFRENAAIDAMRFVDYSGSFHNFIEKVDSDYEYRGLLNDTEKKSIEYVSKGFESGKRSGELYFLRDAIRERDRMLLGEKEYLYGPEGASVIANLNMQFRGKNELKGRYKGVEFIEGDHLSASFREMLNNDAYRSVLEDVVEDGLERNKLYSEKYMDTGFCLWKKYSYEDVCRILLWKTNTNGGAIGGYMYDRRTKTLPIFVNYEKDEGAIGYNDRFVNSGRLIWVSKANRSSRSSDVEHIYKKMPEDENNRIYLFVRKNRNIKSEEKQFFFLGEVEAIGNPQDVVLSDDRSAFEVVFDLETPVRDDIFTYITS